MRKTQFSCSCVLKLQKQCFPTFMDFWNQTQHVQSAPVLTTSSRSSTLFPEGEERRMQRAVVTESICQMVEERSEETERVKEDEHGTDACHAQQEKQSPNGHVKSLSQQTACTFFLILTSHHLTTTTTPREGNKQTNGTFGLHHV